MVREAAVLALGKMNELAPRSLLQQAMADKDTNVRQAAEKVLRGLADVALQHWQRQQCSSPDNASSSDVTNKPSIYEKQLPAIPSTTPRTDIVPAPAYPAHSHLLASLTKLAATARHASIVMLIVMLLGGVAFMLQPPLQAPAEINHIVEYAHYHDIGGKSSGVTWLNNTQFAWVDGNGTIQVANAVIKQSMAMYNTPARVLDLAWVGYSFYTAELQNGAVIIRKDNRQTIFSVPTSSQIPVATFSPNGHYIALALNETSAVTTISIWDTTTGHFLSSYTAQQGTITAIAWPTRGNTLASICASVDRDGQQIWKIEMWDMRTGRSSLTQEPTPYLSLPQRVVGLSWSPDDMRLAYTLADGVVHVHDRGTLIDGTYNTRSVSNSNWDGAIAWSPDGKYLASTDKNGEVQVWNVSGDNKDGQLVCTYMRHKTPVDAISWVPNAAIDRIVSTDISGNLFVWDVQDH
ncbi:hypothetical protein KDK_63670 [Dictyobacter kobayashii]|uniref:Anaphase-promoting complex subunit 4-like WD40 domain-containing protein n=2 Tax=Dictyobacter kobayashii TaxID=2014872 RepID=A0A402AU15_9CHLR|nr:PD40 domain-containing protein [Dictyobacter kobayashii]GCE22567.1 hypothetical protein KDK_63670 [Dictyobacter kobayashii]